ncbi:UDP-N-acetylmuramoyl-tripeptide--D-alanyl-D-alanine ligase [Bacillus testis]|uniref:UDP-N-acetylmuramoyl-tripeptide--D-alanyl-D- alanine ligase n=1 Tax=Bacillus testis TaxID=1622072 RepID=UPI00067F5AE6|nr:UDP-N-acetylmuramoyl-tripeptide--D-alanyl-D-alanine ligase [Bacillus testis]
MIKRTLKQIAEMLDVECPRFQDTEIHGVTIDSRKAGEGQLFVPFAGEHTDGHIHVEQAIADGAGAALWKKDRPNPPEHLPILLVEDPLEALQKLAESYLQQTNAKVVGITGSNGKTTTKDMTASLLAQKYKVHKTAGNYNNHLGLPLTILDMEEDTEIAVLEMGMSSKGEIELLSRLAKPSVAIITNIGESHLLDLGSREAIAEAKMEITTGLREDGVLIYHGDEPLLHDKLADSKWNVLSFGRSDQNDIYPLKIDAATDHTVFTSNLYPEPMTLPILGNHNVLNALAAIMAARQFGIEPDEVKKGLADLKVTNMRMEMVEGKQGEKIINDAYNASPTAMRAAIDLVCALKGFKHKILVLGDMLELGPEEVQFHKMIGESIQHEAIDQLFTYGELGAYIAEGATDNLGSENVFIFQDKEALIEELKKHVSANDLVLVKASRGMKLEDVVLALKA